MGFCRRCGEIVSGVRCRCGGTAVAAVLTWNQGSTQATEEQDKWSKTYVASNKSGPQAGHMSTSASANIPATITTRKFPRPKSTPSVSTSGHLSRGISEHILAATSQSSRPPSPLKFSTTFVDSAPDIIPSLSSNEPTLSKVYGSVLQPKESLPLHSCGICLNVFPPDATIYPDPADVSSCKSFLCRQCYTANGGSKGNCPSCSRPVLALKAEGGFVHSSGKYWHKACFTCVGCFKSIGDTPMVDLFGRPTCADCFDNCLKRDHPATPKKSRTSNNNSPSISSSVRLSSSYGRKSRENSPMIEELEQRLGIARSRESSPAGVDPAGHALDSSKRRASLQLESPKPRRYSNLDVKPSLSPSQYSISSCRTAISQEPELPLRRPVSRAEVQSSQNGSALDGCQSHKLELTPCGYSADLLAANLRSLSTTLFKDASAQKASRASNAPCIPSTGGEPSSTLKTSSCMKCQQLILNPRQGGQFVTIPGNDENDSPKLFHNDCLKCSVCEIPLSDPRKGQASFILSSIGPCHSQCVPVEQHIDKRPRVIKPLDISVRDILDPPTMISVVKTSAGSISIERTLSTIQPRTGPMPRFGGQSACPGCQKAVSPMERGVVPGPQGTRWHSACLVCGGKKDATAARLLGREEKQKGQPGCGKRLDSAAKSDGEGGIWCRQCLLLIGIGGSPQTSPTRAFTVSPPVDAVKILPQSTGATIARHIMDIGGPDILRQLTGGGLSPTRSISPTKQLGAPKSSIRPRPKSVIGMRGLDGDEGGGRGMYLIRQMTGQSAEIFRPKEHLIAGNAPA